MKIEVKKSIFPKTGQKRDKPDIIKVESSICVLLAKKKC